MAIEDGRETHRAEVLPLPRNVREAMAFLQEHARDVVRIEQVADVAGLSVRGLQVAFQRHLDVSPMEYLRRIRLDGVHRALQASDPGDGTTVAEVARRWRFTNVGRLATAYRAVFGTSPSSTLRILGIGLDRQERPGGGADLAGVDRERRRFRLVLDCEVDVADVSALRQTVQDEIDRGDRAWQGYEPSGGSEDLVAFVLGRAVRHAVLDADGVALRSLNPMVRIPAADGSYVPEELPAWAGRSPAAVTDVDGSDVPSVTNEERAHG